jgi:hypothetical protein
MYIHTESLRNTVCPYCRAELVGDAAVAEHAADIDDEEEELDEEERYAAINAMIGPADELDDIDTTFVNPDDEIYDE